MHEWVYICNDIDNGQVVIFVANTYFNGCKMCHINNKNNLLCVPR